MRNTVTYLTIDDSSSGQRIDNFLMSYFKGVPKSHVYQILRSGQVRVNKKRVKPLYRVQVGDELRLPPVRQATPTTATPATRVLEQLEQAILFEDSDLLVINKPAGIAVHGGSGLSFGVIEAFRHLRPEAKALELVHRLDRETSGVLLLAKKRSVLKSLHELFRGQEMQKTYLCAVKGQFLEAEREVNVPLSKNILRSGERVARPDPNGKPSLTVFYPQQVFKRASILEAKPATGRTHQIRVHAAAAGFPIVGDAKYGDFAFNRECIAAGCHRLFLHAYRLEWDSEIWEAPLSAEWKEGVAILEGMR